MGDDLKQARKFVTAAMSDMDILLSEARREPDLAQAALRRVQSGAKSLQARGIYRAAQTALEAYERSMPQAKIDGRLMALYKLTVQYGEGLDEIAPAASVVSDDSDAASPGPNMQSRFDAARGILIPLLPFAGKTAPALQYLADLSLADIATAPRTFSSPDVSFESLMIDVTNTALRTARTHGKSVSVSYAAGELSVRSSQVEEIRAQLENAVEHLVKTHIETPERRAAKGLSRSGYIDITAKDGPNGLDILVICDGKTVPLSCKVEPPQPRPISGGSLDLVEEFLGELSA